jgi:hypothetical protein
MNSVFEHFLKQNVVKDCGELGLVENKLSITKTSLHLPNFSYKDSPSIWKTPGLLGAQKVLFREFLFFTIFKK